MRNAAKGWSRSSHIASKSDGCEMEEILRADVKAMSRLVESTTSRVNCTLETMKILYILAV